MWMGGGGNWVRVGQTWTLGLASWDCRGGRGVVWALMCSVLWSVERGPCRCRVVPRSVSVCGSCVDAGCSRVGLAGCESTYSCLEVRYSWSAARRCSDGIVLICFRYVCVVIPESVAASLIYCGSNPAMMWVGGIFVNRCAWGWAERYASTGGGYVWVVSDGMCVCGWSVSGAVSVRVRRVCQ